MSFTVRSLTPADLPGLQVVQQQYFNRWPGRQPVHAQVYLSPYFAGGQNVLCAVDDAGQVLAYAPYFPQNEVAWVDIQVLPDLPDAGPLQDALFDGLLALARQGGQRCLNFQYAPGETGAIAYTQSRGAACAYAIYNLQRDLATPLPELPEPTGFTIRRWRLASEAEQRAYLAARNECFPEAPTTLEEWQFFAASPLWAEGLNIAAFVSQPSGAGQSSLPQEPELAASVLAFWEPGSASAATEYIFTRAAYRGRGLARAVIAEALRFLKEKGLRFATLEVKAANSGALSVYTSLGYTPVGETQVWIKTTQ